MMVFSVAEWSDMAFRRELFIDRLRTGYAALSFEPEPVAESIAAWLQAWRELMHVAGDERTLAALADRLNLQDLLVPWFADLHQTARWLDPDVSAELVAQMEALLERFGGQFAGEPVQTHIDVAATRADLRRVCGDDAGCEADYRALLQRYPDRAQLIARLVDSRMDIGVRGQPWLATMRACEWLLVNSMRRPMVDAADFDLGAVLDELRMDIESIRVAGKREFFRWPTIAPWDLPAARELWRLDDDPTDAFGERCGEWLIELPTEVGRVNGD